MLYNHRRAAMAFTKSSMSEEQLRNSNALSVQFWQTRNLYLRLAATDAWRSYSQSAAGFSKFLQYELKELLQNPQSHGIDIERLGQPAAHLSIHWRKASFRFLNFTTSIALMPRLDCQREVGCSNWLPLSQCGGACKLQTTFSNIW